MQHTQLFKASGKLLVGLSLLAVTSICSCNDEKKESTEPAKTDVPAAPAAADSMPKKDSMVKDSIPKSGVDSNKTEQNPPPKKATK